MYFGLALSADHEQLLAARIKPQLINAMATKGNALYEPSLVAALLQEKVDEAASGSGQDPDAAKPKVKAKAKGKAKGTAAAQVLDREGLGDPFETEGF